jgi:hypothetical protein
MKIAEKPTIEVPEELLGLILVHLAHDRNHRDKNVSYVAVRLDNAARDYLRSDYARLKRLGANKLINDARDAMGSKS